MNSGKIYNLTTKRYLTIGGQQYEKLKKQGYTIVNNQLVPPNYEKPIEKKSIQLSNPTKSEIPSDIYLHIFSELNINDLIALYSTNKWYKNQLNSQIVLNTLIQKYKLPSVLSFKEYISQYIEYAIYLLNILAPLFNIKYGFDMVNYENFNDETKKWIFENKILNHEDLNDMYINRKISKNLYNIGQLVLPYQIISIIRKNPIYSKAAAWFNKKNDFLPALKSMVYIKIDEPFTKVTIDNSIKKNNLTINDVLFASRALSLENKIGFVHQYKYDRFNILTKQIDQFAWETNTHPPHSIILQVKIIDISV